MRENLQKRLRPTDRGGIAILAALMLLVLLFGAGSGTSRNALRELAIAGDAVQGAKAASAAEAGLEWFLAAAREPAPGPSGTGVAVLLQELDAGPPGQGLAEARLAPPEAALFPASGNSAIQQGFELRIRRLGRIPQAVNGGGGQAAGPGQPGAMPMDTLWLVTATGRARLRGGSRQAFRQVREGLATTPAAEEAP